MKKIRTQVGVYPYRRPFSSFQKNEEGPFMCTLNELLGTLLVKKAVTGSCVQNEPTDTVTDTAMENMI